MVKERSWAVMAHKRRKAPKSPLFHLRKKRTPGKRNPIVRPTGGVTKI